MRQALLVGAVIAASGGTRGLTAPPRAVGSRSVEAAGVRGRVGQTEHVRRRPRADDAAARWTPQPRQRAAAADDSQRLPAPGFSDRRRTRLDEHRALRRGREGRRRNPSQEELQLMLRSLLADRFKLTVHPDKREMPTYAMVLARSDGRTGNAAEEIRCRLRRAGDGAGRASATRPDAALRVHAGIRKPQSSRHHARGARVDAVHLRRPHRRRSDRAGRRIRCRSHLDSRSDFPRPPAAAISRSRSTASRSIRTVRRCSRRCRNSSD